MHRLAFLGAALQTALDGLGDCDRLGHGETDGRVDRHAAISHLLDRGNAGRSDQES